MRIQDKLTGFLAVVISTVAFCGLSACTLAPPGKHFELGPKLNIPRAAHSATLLKDGRVLIAGGFCMGYDLCRQGDVDQAELYDPKTNKFTLSDKLKELPVTNEPILLPDGNVLFIGKQFQVFNSKTEKFELIRTPVKRWGTYTATLLPDGKVLLASGNVAEWIVNKKTPVYRTTTKAMLFDPNTGESSPTGSFHFGRFWHKAIRLQDGEVLILGGSDGKGHGGCVNPPEIYDPKTGKFKLSKVSIFCRLNYKPILLPDGTVLLHGGNNANYGHSFESLPDEIYIPTQDKLIVGKTYCKLREHLLVSQLKSGNILFTGGSGLGYGSESYLFTSEIYNSNISKYTLGPSLVISRYQSTQTILKDGTVLITGGFVNSKTIGISEVYKGGS